MNADGLNPEQKGAVEAGDGPLLIVAGPGTGKTKTLTERVVHLVQSGRAKPQEILALTFTNKAAREMQERVSARLEKQTPAITTFHALAQKLLKQDSRRLASDAERAEIIRSIRKTHGKQWSARDISLLVSKAKNSIQPPEDAVQIIANTYNLELAARGLYDFDDMLLNLRNELEKHPNTTYRHILVDEFQDTNELQYELLRLLNTTDNLFVIGDPLQAIYGFRGADDKIFERFRNDWPAAKEIHLVTNYRSTPEVIHMANAIFPDAPQLVPHRTDAGQVAAVEMLNEYGEAEWLLKEIESQIGGSDMLKSSQYHQSDKQRSFRDFAILYRTHAVARTLQKTLDASGIPYQVAGEGSPYLQPHIQEFFQALSYIESGETPDPGKLSASQARRLLDPLKSYTSLAQLAQDVAEAIGIKQDDNFKLLANALVRFDDKPLREYLEYIRSMADQEYYDPSASAVTLLTIHASKGLEFSEVFVLAAEQEILPLIRQGKVTDLGEEKRLFYVAATRARDNLYLLHARKRSREAREESSFLTGLPAKTITRLADAEMTQQIRKLQRHAQKRSQGSLF
jgi:superfamily I DNA/RNA helicase